MNRRDSAWFARTLVVLLLPLIIAYAVSFTESPMLIGSGLGAPGSEVKIGARAHLPLPND